MRVDLLFDPFGGRWSDMREAAISAERSEFDGIWLYDHLAGSVHDASHVLECWTVLSAMAAAVPRISIGPLVLNVANRDPGTLAVMAATLQEVSGGRLLLGLGAGGGVDTPYASEQEALGRPVPGDHKRRELVEQAALTIRAVWSDDLPYASGFLRPRPAPPVIIGGFGPKMAELAGRIGDGLNAPAGPRLGQLIGIAREARLRAGREAEPFVVTASAGASAEQHKRLADLGVDRAIVFVGAPYGPGVERVASALGR